MKKLPFIFSFFAVIFFPEVCVFGQVQKITSKIESVILFVNGAQLARTADVDLPAGKTELIFEGISPAIEKQSIQVKGIGSFTVLSVTHQLNYLQEQAKREEIKVIELQKYRLQRSKTHKQSQLNVYKQEEAMLLKNQKVGGENTGLNADDLRQAMDFHRSRLSEILHQQVILDSIVTEIDSTISMLDKQLVALNQQKNLATSEILVTVSAESPVRASFEISYLVQNAGWFANYDLRVQDIGSPIDLSFKANVYQNSGEDWQEVKLTLSTGDPKQNGAAPVVEPWYLRFGYPASPYAYQNSQQGNINISGNRGAQVSGTITDINGEPLIGASILLKGTTIGTISDYDGNYSLNLPANANTLVFSYTGYSQMEVGIAGSTIDVEMIEDPVALDEVVVVGYGGSRRGWFDYGNNRKEEKNSSIPIETEETYQPTTVSYKIETPYSIPNDGKVYAVDIKALEIPAIYEYFTAPKFDEAAFLTAKVNNWRELNLLDGEVSLFFEGAYLGKSILDLTNAGDTLEISLGRDKGVIVERKKLRDYTRRQFIGKDKTEFRAFEITIQNNKREAINITIQDQFPISTTKEIDVEKIDYSGASLETDTDILTWKYSLSPRTMKQMSFRYSVKYPKDQFLKLE